MFSSVLNAYSLLISLNHLQLIYPVQNGTDYSNLHHAGKSKLPNFRDRLQQE